MINAIKRFVSEKVTPFTEAMIEFPQTAFENHEDVSNIERLQEHLEPQNTSSRFGLRNVVNGAETVGEATLAAVDTKNELRGKTYMTIGSKGMLLMTDEGAKPPKTLEEQTYFKAGGEYGEPPLSQDDLESIYHEERQAQWDKVVQLRNELIDDEHKKVKVWTTDNRLLETREIAKRTYQEKSDAKR